MVSRAVLRSPLGPGAALLCWLAACLAWGLGAPWLLTAVLLLPGLLWAPGSGLAARLDARGEQSRLGRLLDGVWLSLLLCWLGVSLGRELGIVGPTASVFHLAGAGAATVGGWLLGRSAAPASAAPRRESLGAVAVLVAVVGVFAWRSGDVLRPLDGYWYLEGAAEEGEQATFLQPGEGWSSARGIGWEEAGAQVLVPEGPRQTLVAAAASAGPVVLAVRGPVGSRVAVEVGGQVFENTVQQTMKEASDPNGDRRYLDRGVAAIRPAVELGAGDALEVELDGEALYLFPSAEAVWAAHAVGELRFTDRWQILNQVENLVWAQEILSWRRFTWNQPPGWSPVLALACQLLGLDMPAAGMLFLGVITLVGLQSVRLGSLIAPGAPSLAWLVPGALVAAHGLLMLEPASQNFPDSLFAASVLAVATALAAGRWGWFAGLGAGAQALRWPGTVVSLLLAGAWALSERRAGAVARGALRMGALVLAGVGVAALAVWTGDAEDLLFILYFETFPEHWHGNYDPAELLGRVPGFYLLWLRYTGGGLAVALLGLWGARSPARQALRALFAAVFSYSLLLATVDHHPTHYFLPLVAVTGPMVVAAAALQPRWRGNLLAGLVLVGVGWLLHRGQVW